MYYLNMKREFITVCPNKIVRIKTNTVRYYSHNSHFNQKLDQRIWPTEANAATARGQGNFENKMVSLPESIGYNYTCRCIKNDNRCYM